MIQQVSHPVAGSGPADLGLALEVAYALHAPAARRAPEVAQATAPARPAALRTGAGARSRRRGAHA